MEMTEKRIKILMTVMVSIIVIMVVAFVAKDIYDDSRSEGDNKEVTKEELDKRNNKYKKKKGILIAINGEKSYVLRDYETEEEYVLSSEEEVDIRNEYSKTIEPRELLIGDIVEVGYDKEFEELKYIYIADDVVRYEGLESYKLGKNNKYLQVDSTKYKLSEESYIYSAGKRITMYDLDEKDVLNVNIIGKDIISVNVLKGHGYVNLVNFKNYIGEKLIVNDEDAYDIENETKVSVQEGEAIVIVKTEKLKGYITVDIARGEVTNIDVSKMKFEKKKEGYVTFSVLPEDARLYINGKLVSDKKNILLEYGRYNYNVELTGYDSLIGAFILDEVSQNIKLNMTQKVTVTPTPTEDVSPTPVPTGSKPDPNASVVPTVTASTVSKDETSKENTQGEKEESTSESSASPSVTSKSSKN